MIVGTKEKKKSQTKCISNKSKQENWNLTDMLFHNWIFSLISHRKWLLLSLRTQKGWITIRLINCLFDWLLKRALEKSKNAHLSEIYHELGTILASGASDQIFFPILYLSLLGRHAFPPGVYIYQKWTKTMDPCNSNYYSTKCFARPGCSYSCS